MSAYKNVTSYIQTGSQGIDGMTNVWQKETSQTTKVYTDAKDLLQKLTDSDLNNIDDLCANLQGDWRGLINAYCKEMQLE